MRIVRLLRSRDEADILETNLKWYSAMGVETVAVDDGSTDGSREILRQAKAAGSLTALIELPKSNEIDMRRSLRAGMEAIDELRPDAVILTDADEFFEVADGAPLIDALSADFQLGYNACDFANIEFQLTKADPLDEPNVVKRMRFYAHWPLVMIRAVAWQPDIDVETNFGHRPNLPGVDNALRISPRSYISRHYPLRSIEHFRRKVRRFRPTVDAPVAHNHYLRFRLGHVEPWVNPLAVSRYHDDHEWDLSEGPALRIHLSQSTRALVCADWTIRRLESQVVCPVGPGEGAAPRPANAGVARIPLGDFGIRAPSAGGWHSIVQELPPLEAKEVWITGAVTVEPSGAVPGCQALLSAGSAMQHWGTVALNGPPSSILASSRPRLEIGSRPPQIDRLTLRIKAETPVEAAFTDLCVVAAL